MPSDTEAIDFGKVGHRGKMPAAVAHVSRFTGHALAPLYLVCTAITVFEVFTRYVFHSPNQWAFEMVMTLCALAWVLSAGYVTLYRKHIAITVVTDMAAPWLQQRLSIISSVVSIFAI